MGMHLHLWARAFRASLVKTITSALTERSTLMQSITLPVNYLILLSLFVLSGSNAPTAVIMHDHGPKARAFVQAMQDAHSFRILIESAAEAEQQMRDGTLVALVTIPANFDTTLDQGQPLTLPVVMNNLNEDLTDDARRGLGLSVTLFYARAFPAQVSIVTQEDDQYTQDTDYLPFLAISIVVISLLITGLLQAGMSAACEWEQRTITTWKLSPAPAWVIQLGQMIGSAVVALPSVAVVLTLVVLVSGWPTHPALVLGVSGLALLCFVAAGTALGTAVKERGTLTIFARAASVPLFFLSGVFGAISFNTPAVMWLARLFPVHYAIVLMQAGFKGFVMNTLPPEVNLAIVGGFSLLFVLLAQLALHSSRVAHS